MVKYTTGFYLSIAEKKILNDYLDLWVLFQFRESHNAKTGAPE